MIKRDQRGELQIHVCLLSHHQIMTQCSHLRSFTGSCVLLLLPLLLFLLQLLDALLQHIGPEVAFKVWQLISAGQAVLCRLFEDVLKGRQQKQTSF